MDSVRILVGQLIIMFLYMLVGWLLRKANLITESTSKALSNLLLYVILPCVILKSYLQADKALWPELLVAIGLGALTLLIAIAIAHLMFRKDPIANFGAAFSNAGFMEIPLISALLGQTAVFYISGMVALLNILQWTYGQALLSKSREECSPRMILKNPLVVSFLLELIIFLTPISLPTKIITIVDAFAACNAPVAMVILGVLLGNVSLRELCGDLNTWLVSGVRLLVIPVVTALIFSLFKSVSVEMKTALLIAAADPIGSNLAEYVQKNNGDSSRAVGMICLSTILSAVTMPLIMFLIAS